jgi:aspartyl protease family protein
MLFVGVALLIAFGLGLLVSTDAVGYFGLTSMQVAEILPLVILLIIFAAGFFTQRQRFSSIVGNLVVWVGIFAAGALGYAYREDLTAAAGRMFSDFNPTSAIIDSKNGTASFRRGLDGHFLVATSVNGTSMPLLFDTGASAVVLSYTDARRAGIDVNDLTFDVAVTTANGTGRAALVTLDRMEVGGIVRSKVQAFVAERGALQGSLLGMTFLETLSRYSVAGNTLELAD